MSTNKKFRIQNGADIVGELSINDVTVIGADGKIVAGAIADAVADLTASDIADLQSQVTAILGTSPETLDTLQEIVNAFQDADTNLVADVASNTSDIATINTTLTSGVATTAQGAKADTAVQPEDFFTVADGSTTSYVADWTPSWPTGYTTTSLQSPLDLVADVSSSPDGHSVIVYKSASGQSDKEYRISVFDPTGNQIKQWQFNIDRLTGTNGFNHEGKRHESIFSADITDTHVVIMGPQHTATTSITTVEVYELSDLNTPVGFDNYGGYGFYSNDFTSNISYANGQAAYIRMVGDYIVGGSDGKGTGTTNKKWKAFNWKTGVEVSGIPPTHDRNFYNMSVDKSTGWVYISAELYQGGDTWKEVRGYNILTGQTADTIKSSDAPWNGISGSGDNFNEDNQPGQVAVGSKYVVVSPGRATGSQCKTIKVYALGTNNLVTSITEHSAARVGNAGTTGGEGFVSTMGNAVVFTADMYPATTYNIHVYDVQDNGTKTEIEVLAVSRQYNYPIAHLGESHTLWSAGGKSQGSNPYSYSRFTPGPVTEVLTPNVDASTIASKVYVDNAVANADSTTEMTTAIATAKSEAISTASADATAKADAAESDAKAYADQVVAATVDAAPAALDTLNELAAALGDDANFASTVTASIATKASQVDHDAEVTRATAAEAANAAAIAAANSRTSGISTSSGAADIQMTAELDMDSNNIKNANDVYAARGFIDTIESNDLKVQTGTVDFEGSIVNFGSSQITGGGFGTATKAEVDAHLNIPTANAGEFVKWTGTDYEWTDLVSGRLATDQLQVASGGSIAITGPGGTFDFQDGIVMLSGSDVRVDTPTDVGQAANKGYVDGVVAATVDAAPAALDTLNELAAALGDDANFSATVTNSIATKADDAATTAALATKADDAATTAALATKATVVDVDALDTFVKGSDILTITDISGNGGNYFNTAYGSGSNVSQATVSGHYGTKAYHEVVYKGSSLPSGSYSLDYDVHPSNGGTSTIAIYPSTFNSWSSSAGSSWEMRYEASKSSQLSRRDISSGSGTFNFSTSEEFYIVLTTQNGGGTTIWQFDNDALVRTETAASIATTASEIIPAINELHTELNALSSTQSGDQSNLQAQVTAEVARATSAEAVNAANIVSETSARSSADAALESDIIGLQNQVGTIISGSPASLDTLVEIVSAFENADSDLSGVITANGGRLTTAENNITALETDLSAEESARGAGDAALQANIDAEAATRSGLGSQLLGYININGAAIIAGDNANSAEVATEKSRAEGAEATLQSNIDALTSSTGGDVSGLQANIDAEASTRSSADSALQSSIDAEESRATSAEAGLQSQISNVLSNTDATALNSLAEIVAEFQSADSTLTGAVAGHGTRLTSLESSTSAILAWDTDNVSEGSTNKYWTPERTKTALSGGLCITYNSSTGEIKIDEAETAAALHVASSTDANGLGGQAPSHYRIDVYDVNGTVVN